MKKNLRKIILGGLAVSCVTLAVTAANLPKNDISASADVIAVLNDEYYSGEKFVVPEGKIVVDGKEYPATESIVVYPNGNAYTLDEYVLNKEGKYNIIYSAEINNKKVSAEKEFYVKKGICSFLTDKSSYWYGKNPMDNNGATEGLNVKLADGDTFTFNQPIDLTKYTETNPFLSIYPRNKIQVTEKEVQKKDEDGNDCFDEDGNPIMETQYESKSKYAYNEVEMFNIRLTDCYDPSVFIEYEIHWVERDSWAYYRANASNQPKLGLYPGGQDVDINGVSYVVRYNSGTNVGMMRALNNPFEFCYDYESTKAYVLDQRGYDKVVHFVTQFNNTDIYNANAFKGFTTGEVFLSVFGGNYSLSHMNFCIKEIDGLKGDTLNFNTVSDKKAPEIKLNLRGGHSDTYTIAKGEEFKVFDGIATDLNYDESYGLKKAVYYGYGTKDQTQINLLEDKFTPTKLGEYTLVYTARDTFGNIGKKLVKLNVCDLGEDGIISFKTDKITKLNAGESIILPEYTIKGYNGKIDMSIYAINLKTNEKIKINVDNRQFTPKDICEYEFVYDYGDPVKDYRFTYKVNSISSNFINFNKYPILPQYVIKGMSYSLDEVTVNEYTGNSPSEKAVEVYISEDAGEYNKIDIQNFKITGNSNIKFKYTYKDWSFESEIVPVVDVGYGDDLRLQDYFVGDFEKSALGDSLQFISNSNSGSNTLQFINPISMELFNIEFKIPDDYSQFNGVTFTLIDYYDRDNKIAIEYKVIDDELALSIDGSKPLKLGNSYVNKPLGIFYYNSTQRFIDLSGKSIMNDVKFTSDKVLFTVTLNDIKGNAGVLLTKLNNSPLNDLTFDLSAPQIVLPNKVNGIKQKGDKLIVSPAVITDVLSPILKKDIQLIVKAPDDSFVVSVDGVTLDGTNDNSKEYEIELKDYGIYIVSYLAVDQNEQSYLYSYNIMVKNKVAPEITLKGSDKDIKVKLGENVGLPHMTVTDDNTEVDKIQTAVIVLSPTNEIIYVKDYAFKADVKGEYIVNYYAYDIDGNYVIKTVKVIVE